MKKLFLFALTLVASAALANTDCSDASGEVQYHHEDYNRGTPPRNGDVIGVDQIRVGGKLVSDSIYYKGLNPELGPMNSDFSEETVLHRDSGSSGFTKDYSAKLTLTKTAANPNEVKEIQLPYAAYVVCRYNFLAIP
jgi:hypothetical protein